MSKEITITLSGKDYKIKTLTLRQRRDITQTVLMPAPPPPAPGTTTQENETFNLEWALGIIAAALSRDHKEMTREAILDLEMENDQQFELTKIAQSILVFAGYAMVKKEDQASGEAPAGEKLTGNG